MTLIVFDGPSHESFEIASVLGRVAQLEIAYASVHSYVAVQRRGVKLGEKSSQFFHFDQFHTGEAVVGVREARSWRSVDESCLYRVVSSHELFEQRMSMKTFQGTSQFLLHIFGGRSVYFLYVGAVRVEVFAAGRGDIFLRHSQNFLPFRPPTLQFFHGSFDDRVDAQFQSVRIDDFEDEVLLTLRMSHQFTMHHQSVVEIVQNELYGGAL